MNFGLRASRTEVRETFTCFHVCCLLNSNASAAVEVVATPGRLTPLGSLALALVVVGAGDADGETGGAGDVGSLALAVVPVAAAVEAASI